MGPVSSAVLWMISIGIVNVCRNLTLVAKRENRPLARLRRRSGLSALCKFVRCAANGRFEPIVTDAAQCTNVGNATPATTSEVESLCSPATPLHRS